MLTVAEAQKHILEHTRPLRAERQALSTGILGRVLAEEVASDLDMPPYDKSLVDGYALRSVDLITGQAVLDVVEEVTAGQTPQKPVGPGQATRIMTGAPIPQGIDAVIMVERTRLVDGGRVQIEDEPPRPGQHILPRGREMHQGEVVLLPGILLRPQEIGLLATVGQTSVQVYPAPDVTVLSTGDELVEADRVPGPGQIRNGNGPMLLAQVARAGGLPRALGIARDQVAHLRSLIGAGLQSHVLVLSGGVSAGKLDLVPGVLAEHKVQAIFHKVEMKPGRPMLFGVRDNPGKPPTLVFGLPGNPVSALVCFELFVRPAIRVLRGLSHPGPMLVEAMLMEDYRYRTDRPTYHPARLHATEQGWSVRAVPWFGSPDLRGVTPANAFVVFPVGDHHHCAGQIFPVLKVEGEE